MKLLFLRCHVPVDLNLKETMFDSLDSDMDVWVHLAAALGDERTEIVLWGGKRTVQYSDKITIRWVGKLKHYKPAFEPDVIFERGGFDEGRHFVKRFPDTFKIYYGSGARYRPKKGVDYGLVLVDSERQLQKARKHGWNAQLWIKPAAPQFQYMPEVAKEFDVCYVGDGRFPFRNKIKRVDWVYKHAPKDLKILHLGWSGGKKPPSNITVKRVPRSEMPLWYNRCRVGVVPYSNYDSAPRVIPEMMACGIIPVICDEVHQNYMSGVSINETWDYVKLAIEKPLEFGYGHGLESDVDTIPDVAKHIKGLIADVPIKTDRTT